MTATADKFQITRNTPIPTWYRVGGGADAFAQPETVDQLQSLIAGEGPVRVLGEGANLLVDDDGIDGTVARLNKGSFAEVSFDPETKFVVAGAGVDLRRLITHTSKQGLAGLEVLGGIPASVGGAIRMNAGGAFGQICQAVARVTTIDRQGRVRELDAREIDFGYRYSGLEDRIIMEVAFALTPDDPVVVRDRFRACMEYKKRTQPMGEHSAGCTFKNPMLTEPIEGVGHPGARVSAGQLIDLAGCKGMRVGGAEVSQHHANFFTTRPGATAADLIHLMEQVERRVFDRFGVRLEREVVVWRRPR